MTDTGLVARDLGVRYGGLIAVDGLSLDAPAGRITGLIGPNGAGKSTTFNALCGVVRATGTVSLEGRSLDGLSPRKRALQGLGRTFQRTQLFDTMTVAENVSMGPELLDAGRGLLPHLFARRADRRRCLAAAADAMARCEIEHLATSYVGDLSTGSRRLVELAREIAAGQTFLLLDEPSSGLDAQETERFAAILQGLAASGVGILLVEHDMSLVRTCCSSLFVLDFGRPLLSGPASDVLASPELKAAYLGTDDLEAVG